MPDFPQGAPPLLPYFPQGLLRILNRCFRVFNGFFGVVRHVPQFIRAIPCFNRGLLGLPGGMAALFGKLTLDFLKPVFGTVPILTRLLPGIYRAVNDFPRRALRRALNIVACVIRRGSMTRVLRFLRALLCAHKSVFHALGEIDGFVENLYPFGPVPHFYGFQSSPAFFLT
jgi:hypothetical protein